MMIIPGADTAGGEEVWGGSVAAAGGAETSSLEGYRLSGAGHSEVWVGL